MFHTLVQPALRLTTFNLPRPPTCWDYRDVSTQEAFLLHLKKSSFTLFKHELCFWGRLPLVDVPRDLGTAVLSAVMLVFHARRKLPLFKTVYVKSR